MKKKKTMKNFIRLFLFYAHIIVFCLITGCGGGLKTHIKSDLRAPAFPLITIDPYTSAWSFTDNLFDDYVRHWTGKSFPLVGAIRVDGEVYRFMGSEGRLKAIAGTADAGPWMARYTFGKPGKGWETPDFDDSSWKEGRGAFGNGNNPVTGTIWEGDNTDVWVRREVILTDEDLKSVLTIEYSHDDCFELYLNGKEIANTGNKWRNNIQIQLTGDLQKLLKAGKNVIAVHGHNTIGGSLVDFGLLKSIPASSFSKTAVQKYFDVQATQTHYGFSCGSVDLSLSFIAPLLLNNLELISRPVNYLAYEVSSADGKTHDVELYFEAAPAWALDMPYQESVSGAYEKDGLVFLKTGSKAQNVLGKSGDDVRIDWGYFFLCADKTNAAFAVGDEFDLRADFVGTGTIGNRAGDNNASGNLALVQHIGQVKKNVSGKIMIGYDDLYSIQYFGENLRPYWNRDGKHTIEWAFLQADKDFDKLKKDCERFDSKLMSDAAMAGGKEYAELCALAYRQTIAAHKLVQAANNDDLLFFSKECFSNGCIGTVDVTFPSSPLFLLYNPELVKGLLNPIFYYSESGKNPHPVAAHDLGAYPLANGSGYPHVMPVEECGNMLILTAAIVAVEGNADYAAKHWETLTTWMNYLSEKGLDPENQLCTDDFTGHLAHNTNLSVKAILGIASYGYLAGKLGKHEDGKYVEQAKSMASEWIKMADDGDHFRLAFDRPGTWSQKYNLVWDRVLNFDIFPKEVVEKEILYYLARQNLYGVPLDYRAQSTKSDWIMWTATLSPNKATFEKFISPMYRFMNETGDRVPMTDYYFTDRPNLAGFRARSVVGGYFMKMLDEKFKQ